MGKRILLVQPPILYWRWFEIAPTLPHLLSIGSYLKQNGFEVDMVDMQIAKNSSMNDGWVTFKTLHDFVEISERILTSYKYDILAVSCWTSLHYVPSLLLSLISKVINAESISVVGGYHPSTMPSDFVKLISEGQVKILDSEKRLVDIPDKLVSFAEEAQRASNVMFDYVVKGEGENAFLQICRRHETKPKKGGHEASVVSGEPLNDLDKIDYDFSLLSEAYDPSTSLLRKDLCNKTFPIHLSRGCPFDCEFCIEKSKGTHNWRAVSPRKAADMIRNIKKTFGPKRIQFMDVCFGADSEWTRKFIALLAQEDNSETMYWCETAVNCTSMDKLKEFSKVPIEVDFGVESASPRILALMKKTHDPHSFIEHHRKLVENCIKLSIPSTSFFVWGFPGESKETLKETLTYQKQMLSIAEKFPYIDSEGQDFRLAPGSDVYSKMEHYSERYGTVFRCPDWWTYVSTNLDQLATAVDPSKDLTLEEKREIYERELAPNLSHIIAQKLRDYMCVSARLTTHSNRSLSIRAA